MKTTSRTRLDGTPITPTCTIPVKRCGCLAGDDCECLDMGDDVFAEPLFWDLRGVAA
uniref:hypothetical protein n=1 Tax=Paractinoplanes polyasparticus TaxID=2856853 RepID=UPI001C85146D|nr:hypothetical protein [Actinoplanes polyasparticus]